MAHHDIIDIVIPCKNAGLYVEECLSSILNQDYLHWRCTIIDDGSNDNSRQIAGRFEHKDRRFSSILSKGHGIIDALQTGYEKCNGTFITRMDADDIMLPSKLESLLSLLKKHGPGHIACGKVKYFSEGKLGEGYIKYQNWINECLNSANTFDEIYKECVIPSPSWMMYRVDFEAIQGFNSNEYPEDYDLAFRMYAHKLKVLASQSILHLWRDYSNRTSRTDDHYSDNSFIQIKIKYFLEIDRQADQPLIIWGAGKKGKQVAQYLIKREYAFIWLSNNPKKIGHNIYGTIIQSTSSLKTDTGAQILVALANPNDIEMIKKQSTEHKALQFYFLA